MGTSLITAAQCRAARAMIDWTEADLEGAANVPAAAIVEFEQGNGRVPRAGDVAAIRSALEGARIIFVAETYELGPGVQLSQG